MKRALKLSGRIVLGLAFWPVLVVFTAIYFLVLPHKVGDTVLEALGRSVKRVHGKEKKKDE